MERTSELDNLLQTRLARDGTVPLPDDVAEAAKEIHQEENQVDQRPQDESPQHGDLKAFWRKRESEATFAPAPVSGVTGKSLGTSAAAAYAVAAGKVSNISFPLTSSSTLPYHGKNMNHLHPNLSNRPRSRPASSNFGGVNDVTKDDASSLLLHGTEADNGPLSEAEFQGLITEDTGDDLVSGEKEEESRLVETEEPSSAPAVSSPTPTQNQIAFYRLPARDNVDVGSASSAVIALLRATDFCLSVGSSPPPATSQSSRAVFEVPRKALLKLLGQFRAVQQQGLVDMKDVVEGFQICQRSVRRQRRLLKGFSFRQSTAEFLGCTKEKKALADSTPKAQVDAALLENLRNTDWHSQLGSAGGDDLLNLLQVECNSLRKKFHLQESEGQESLLMLCDKEDELGRITTAPTVELPPTPREPVFGPETALETLEKMASPVMIPRMTLRMTSISQAANPETMKQLEDAVEVVNVVPLPLALLPGAGVIDVDDIEESDEEMEEDESELLVADVFANPSEPGANGDPSGASGENTNKWDKEGSEGAAEIEELNAQTEECKSPQESLSQECGRESPSTRDSSNPFASDAAEPPYQQDAAEPDRDHHQESPGSPCPGERIGTVPPKPMPPRRKRSFLRGLACMRPATLD